ncbi:hypothetical protein GCM10009677_05650 [Sphaerisporangium rubeum]
MAGGGEPGPLNPCVTAWCTGRDRPTFRHARISVTMEIYTHGDQDSHREAISRISGELFGGGNE